MQSLEDAMKIVIDQFIETIEGRKYFMQRMYELEGKLEADLYLDSDGGITVVNPVNLAKQKEEFISSTLDYWKTEASPNYDKVISLAELLMDAIRSQEEPIQYYEEELYAEYEVALDEVLEAVRRMSKVLKYNGVTSHEYIHSSFFFFIDTLSEYQTKYRDLYCSKRYRGLVNKSLESSLNFVNCSHKLDKVMWKVNNLRSNLYYTLKQDLTT